MKQSPPNSTDTQSLDEIDRFLLEATASDLGISPDSIPPSNPDADRPVDPRSLSAFLDPLKEYLLSSSTLSVIPLTSILNSRLLVLEPKNWFVALIVPNVSGMSAAAVRPLVEKYLFSCPNFKQDSCHYYGLQFHRGGYEWQFFLPSVPQAVLDRLEAERLAEMAYELPVPSGKPSVTNTAVVRVYNEIFEDLESGEKTVEYRSITQYYCDKFFSPGIKKTRIKFLRGKKATKDDELIFEIKKIVFANYGDEVFPTVDERGNPIISKDAFPADFKPIWYAIYLGKRIK